MMMQLLDGHGDDDDDDGDDDDDDVRYTAIPISEGKASRLLNLLRIVLSYVC
jgi:hypothetical protein